MPNNQGFLTGTGGAASAYTVGASDVGAGVLAQQMHPMYFDSATNTWKTVNTNDRLPVAIAGVATAANQATGNTSLASVDGKLTTTTVGSVVRLNTTLASSGTTGTAAPTVANLYAGTDGTNLRAISTDSSGRQRVVLDSQVLPASGGNLAIGVTPTATQVTGTGTATQFITLQNSYASASYLYYGFSSGTATPATGLELKVGDIVNLPLSAATSLWLSANLGSSATAKIGWM